MTTLPDRLAAFIAKLAADVYPEPPSDLHSNITAQMAERVAKYLQPGATVLDVGCGQGPALRWLTQHGFDATGITLGDEDVAACREAGLFKVFKGDMHSIGLDSYDCVWARHVLEHSPIPLFALAEFHRVLNPGGILYAEMPMPSTAAQHTENRNHYSVFTADAWDALIRRSGFEITEAVDIKIQLAIGEDHYHAFVCKRL